ncbi:hypothetical protein SAMN05216277_102209 [Halolamina pelagica]|uniref:Uncharacterized protein n=1 Tax=Halolamina pelagica TaxID=699431 RepID=A0A1I5NV08_9EURY|nr:hypothetical protein SAMN05216277_102209 [Halolamina pelagica]
MPITIQDPHRTAEIDSLELVVEVETQSLLTVCGMSNRIWSPPTSVIVLVVPSLCFGV